MYINKSDTELLFSNTNLIKKLLLSYFKLEEYKLSHWTIICESDNIILSIKLYQNKGGKNRYQDLVSINRSRSNSTEVGSYINFTHNTYTKTLKDFFAKEIDKQYEKLIQNLISDINSIVRDNKINDIIYM